MSDLTADKDFIIVIIVWQFKIKKIVGSLIVVRFIMFGFELPLAFCEEYENYTFLETS